MDGSRGGWTGGPDPPHWKITSGYRYSLEILVRTPLEKQLDSGGPIASRGRFVRPSVICVDD